MPCIRNTAFSNHSVFQIGIGKLNRLLIERNIFNIFRGNIGQHSPDIIRRSLKFKQYYIGNYNNFSAGHKLIKQLI